jgi:alanyl-tRNA synthetase
VTQHSLAPAEPTVREFETTVDAVDGRAVRLAETYFYPEGGGQPADRGTLAGHPVSHVESDDDGVVHRLDAAHDLAPGDRVAGVVDDAFRTYCARAHTASHVLFGAGRRLCADLGYGGFDIGEETVRVDLSTPTEVDDDLLVDLERLTNRAVWDARDVSWERVPADEARSRDGVAFNDATEAGAFADGGRVRLVTVADWDVAACGGTHVENTVEIGPVAVVDRSNPGAGLTRVEFAVGPRALEETATRHRQTRAAARALDAAPDAVAETARALRAERDDLRETVADLRRERVERTVAAFPAVERDGATWRVGVVDADTDAAGAAVRGTTEGVVAAVGRDGATFVVAASGGDPPASAVVAAATDEFGGGGGGSDRFAQGGGIDADPERVAAYLRDETDRTA